MEASGNARGGQKGQARPARCAPAGARSTRIGAHRDVGHAPARKTPTAIGHAGYSPRIFECHADMPTSPQAARDRRRVVHGIAIGREQVEHGGHPSMIRAQSSASI